MVALEAERLANLDVSEASLADERQVVIEERRFRTESSPEGRLFEALMAWSTLQGTEALDAIAADETLDPLTALHRLAAQLLALMLQPKKLALFRIAVAEGEDG